MRYTTHAAGSQAAADSSDKEYFQPTPLTKTTESAFCLSPWHISVLAGLSASLARVQCGARIGPGEDL